MRRKVVRLATFGLILILAMVVVTLLWPTSRRPATNAERDGIAAALAAYHQAKLMPTAATAPTTLPSGNILRLDDTRVSVHDAVAEYSLSLEGAQLVSEPRKAKLVWEDGRWRVVETRPNHPLWWEIVNITVGVK